LKKFLILSSIKINKNQIELQNEERKSSKNATENAKVKILQCTKD